MNSYRRLLTGFTLVFASIFSIVLGNSVLIKVTSGEVCVLEVPINAKVAELMENLETITGIPLEQQLLISEGRVFGISEKLYAEEGQVFWLGTKNDSYDEEELIPKKTYPGYRNYFSLVSKGEKNDIRFILKSLSTKSLPSLLGNMKQLRHAGDRIIHLHPLRFLECVFTDEELKAYAHNVRKRGGMIWSEFFDGISDSLKDEMGIENMKDEYIHDFASIVGIEVSIIYGFILAQKWDDFIKALVIHIPRDGDTGRYDQ
ncbi:MAG: hypothetical protein K940chlam7_01241 [Chlamydiae bacterium]|nr:hypothetical protein [Chlamydiota bacterium]